MARAAQSTRTPQADAYEIDAAEFLRLKEQADAIAEKMSSIRKRILDKIVSNGEEDDKGHMWLDFPQPIEGFVGFQRQRRVSAALDYDKAIELLEKHGLLESCTVMKPEVDEDAVMKAVWRGELSDEDLAKMYPQKITFALKPIKE